MKFNELAYGNCFIISDHPNPLIRINFKKPMEKHLDIMDYAADIFTGEVIAIPLDANVLEVINSYTFSNSRRIHARDEKSIF